MPEPHGKEFYLRMYVDSDRAGGKKTRIYSTGVLIDMNKALVWWLSKKQPRMETSVFRDKFVAMEIGLETLQGFVYKIRMMGIPLLSTSLIYGDNMSVVHNTQIP